MGRVATMKKTEPHPDVITMTLGALVYAGETALKNLCAMKLSASAAYRLSKMARIVGEETTHYYEQRDSHGKDLGTMDGKNLTIPAEVDEVSADGTIVKKPNPNLDEFMRRMTDVSNVSVELAIRPFPLSDLGDNTISAADLLALGPLVTGDDEKGTA